MNEHIIAPFTDQAADRYDGRGNKQCPLCGRVVFESEIEEHYEDGGERRIECCTDCREDFEEQHDVAIEADVVEPGIFNMFWDFAVDAIKEESGMEETLEKVVHDLQFAGDGLREALKQANAVESLMLLPLIGRTEELRRNISAFAAARKADAKG